LNLGQLDTQRRYQLEVLQKEIIQCSKCPRLSRFRKKVAREKRRQFANFAYWGRPVPGFGDPDARLVVIGLAPAAHGGNRTGRVFTGDSSAIFLVKHLYQAGFANQPISENRDDGLSYTDCYITAAVRCVPPENKPTGKEMDECFPYLSREIALLKNCRVILALGKIAFDSIIRVARENYGFDGKLEFKHNQRYQVSENFPIVYASYHPSPRNTNTGKMTSEMFGKVLGEVNIELGRPLVARSVTMPS
jgi:uracil-DNA glycosylase